MRNTARFFSTYLRVISVKGRQRGRKSQRYIPTYIHQENIIEFVSTDVNNCL